MPIVFLINGITKQDWLAALLFSVSIAVGLTPEMLPTLVSTNLAKGAVEEVLSISSFVDINEEIIPITDEIKENLYAQVTGLNAQGMRIIAVAQKRNVPD